MPLSWTSVSSHTPRWQRVVAMASPAVTNVCAGAVAVGLVFVTSSPTDASIERVSVRRLLRTSCDITPVSDCRRVVRVPVSMLMRPSASSSPVSSWILSVRRNVVKPSWGPSSYSSTCAVQGTVSLSAIPVDLPSPVRSRHRPCGICPSDVACRSASTSLPISTSPLHHPAAFSVCSLPEPVFAVRGPPVAGCCPRSAGGGA